MSPIRPTKAQLRVLRVLAGGRKIDPWTAGLTDPSEPMRAPTAAVLERAGWIEPLYPISSTFRITAAGRAVLARAQLNAWLRREAERTEGG